MTIYASSRHMTSSVTPDWAWRPSRFAAEPAWRLSWEPDSSVLYTREQARAAMELRELLHAGLVPEPAAERGHPTATPVRRVFTRLHLRR
ncbi:hypothetical protein [Nocardia goodfellowii]|uniref:Uncharacterized protein n=1 Tax=Nocardia goodfellowii TaxID=882446 RepID=A0ABS4QJG9_9NOCA|nr:hypothetical protein [Nocardia goodfellowii]MBP2191850.1 hypothetical protein [Nocardia goodfellowii]